MSENVLYNEIWEAARAELQRQCGYSNSMMRLWFDVLDLVLLTDKRAVFNISSNFKCEHLKEKYTGDIENAMFSVLGYRVEADIRSTEDTDSEIEKSDVLIRETIRKAEAEKAKKTEKIVKMAIEEASSGEGKEDREYYSDVGGSKVLNYAMLKTYEKYTFDNFVCGKSNEFARAAALSVAQNPAKEYNPLFIYGPSGIGKTHLLYAISNYIKEHNPPDYKIVIVQGEDFTNQLVDSIAQGRSIVNEFKDKYRTADVLLLDDIQFAAGKNSTQEEFFNTFNALYEDHKQIILTSDRPPRDIPLLENRLRTRFESGLIVDIQPPDYELRMAILQMKAKELGLDVPQSVIAYVAENLKSNVRQLEGAIKRIGALNTMTGSEITHDLAIRSISDMMTAAEPVNVTVNRVIDAVATHYGITVEDMKSKKRTSNVAFARHVAVYIIKTLTTMSFQGIGKVFSRDHSTIMSSYDVVDGKIKSDTMFESEINELMNKIKQ